MVKEVQQITSNKEAFFDLLLLGDEQAELIAGYLPQSELFALYEDGLKTVAAVVVTENICELKNLATVSAAQRQGYGSYMLSYLCHHYQGRCHTMLVGTGESPLTLPFYLHRGFQYSHRIKNFFLQYYDHPIWEGGHQLVDMIYLQRKL